MLSTQTGKFQKFEFQTLAGISSNTGRSKSNQIKFYWCCTVLARPSAVAMLLDDATVEPSAPSPTQARRSGGETSFAPRAPSQSPSALLDADHFGGARAGTQHPAAEPTPSQHAHVTAVTGTSFKRRQGPRAGELLVALFPVAPAYKKPRRSNEEKHLTPSSLPDTVV
jgi:hypothetical protein